MSEEDKDYAPVVRDPSTGRIVSGANRRKGSKSKGMLQISRATREYMRARYGREGEFKVLEWVCDVGEDVGAKPGDRVKAAQFIAAQMWGRPGSQTEMALARAAYESSKQKPEGDVADTRTHDQRLADMLQSFNVLAGVGVVVAPGGALAGRGLPAPAPASGAGEAGEGEPSA